MTTYTPAQLEAWAGLGPWRISSTSTPPLIYSPGLWIASIYADSPGEREHHKTNAALIAAAPDLARLVLEKDAEIARLKAQIQDIKECWDWWQEDTYDRCSSVVDDAIRQAMKEETSDE